MRQLKEFKAEVNPAVPSPFQSLSSPAEGAAALPQVQYVKEMVDAKTTYRGFLYGGLASCMAEARSTTTLAHMDLFNIRYRGCGILHP